MIKTKGKTGSKVIVNCSICGESKTRAGLVGHMRFKHGRDWKKPMIPVEKPLNLIDARAAATDWRDLFNLSGEVLPPTPCCQAKFELLTKVGLPDKMPKAIWQCPACKALYQDTLEMEMTGDTGKGEQPGFRFYRQVVRLP